MARMLLLATLVISAPGCAAVGDQRNCQDKELANGADGSHVEELELQDGGPKSLAVRQRYDSGLAATTTDKVDQCIICDQQVRLRIVIAEADRPAVRAMGFAISNKEGDDSTKLPWLLDNGEALNLVGKKLGRARVLAERDVIVRSGEAVKYILNDSFTMLGLREGGGRGMLSGVFTMPLAVQSSFTPTIADRNRIFLELHARISTRDNSPATVQTRRLSTTIEMSNGKTFGIAGLLENTFEQQSSLMSRLAGVPALYRLVESDAGFVARELVMLMTLKMVQDSENKKK